MKKILLSILALLALAGTGTAQTLPSYVPANGLVGWWPFNGNANDESGNNNNGTVNGATLTSDRFGNGGKAYSFDGVDDFINYGNSILNLADKASVSFWFKKTNFNNIPQSIYNKRRSLVGDGFLFGFSQNSCAAALNREPGIFVSPYGTPFVEFDSTWNHAVVTWNDSILSLYLNGIKRTEKALPSGPFIGSEPFYLGKGFDVDPGGGIRAFDGKIDDVTIYNRALTQQEITALYQGANTTANCPTFPASLTQGLVGYWPFCGNALDESGNNNHGTVNGATLTTDRFGNSGSAYGFDGSGNYILIQNAPSLQTPEKVSINVWVKFLGSGTNAPRLISKGWSPNGIEIHVASPDKKIAFGGSFNGTGYGPTSTTQCLEESWYMITAIDNGNFKRIYVNGVLEDSINHGHNSIPINTIDLVFGKNSQVQNSDFLNGSLDDIAIWNRALSQSEISQLYNQGICQTSITVTDTLLIHTGLTSYNPVAYGNTLKVWPNPGNTAITLDAGNLSSMQGWKYKVANTLGQTVVNETAINQQQTNISLSTWGGNGIYYLHLINPQGHAIEVKKIVLAP